MKARDYQIELSTEAADKLRRLNIAYLAMEVRTGKTLTALLTAQKLGARSVLFLTKKKAIQSIYFDYENYDGGFDFSLEVSNDESLHKRAGKYDLIIHDEHHRFGAFPKPNATAKEFKKRFSRDRKSVV